MKCRLFLIPAVVIGALPERAAAADLLLAVFGGDVVVRSNGVTTPTVFATSALMDGPTALAYDPDGNLLVLNEFSNNVLKFNGTTGAYISTLIDSTALGPLGLDPADMEVGADGTLYIMGHFNSPSGSTKNVHKFNPTTGAYLGPFASTAIRHQHGLSFGPGGDIFQGNVDTRSVERFDGTSAASEGSFAGDMDMFPIGDLAFSPTRLFVTVHTGGLAQFDSATGAFVSYIEPTAGLGYWGLTVDSGFLYASNLSAGTIRKYDASSGAFVSESIVGGGVFDILPMAVPEAGSIAFLFTSFLLVSARRTRRPFRPPA